MTVAELRALPDGFVELHPTHDEYRIHNYPGVSPEMWAFEVGNFQTTPPEVKCQGNPTHHPVCRPDTLEGHGFGWAACDYLLVLPAPSQEDILYGTCLMSRGGEVLRRELKEAGFEPTRCLVTHAIRFALPDGEKTFKEQHKRANAPYVRADAYACKPKVIITFGADALKAFFGHDAKLDNFRGTVHTWEGIPVVPTISPAVFTGTTGGIEVFKSELFRAQQVLMNAWHPISGWLPGYRVLENADQLEAFERELAEKNVTHLCVDTEFGNDCAREEFNYLLTWQCCWAEGQAVVMKLRGERGAVIHSPEERARIAACLQRIQSRAGVKLIGQHLRVDIEMPSREGINIDETLATGFDTMLANHLLFGSEGDESEGLDHLVRKYCPEFGPYWKPLEDWLSDEMNPVNDADVQLVNQYHAEMAKYQDALEHYRTTKVTVVSDERDTGLFTGDTWEDAEDDSDDESDGGRPLAPTKPKFISGRNQHLRFGYRNVPHSILLLYACYDADANFRAAMKLMAEMDKPANARLKHLFENIVMPTSLHLLDVERQGLKVDLERVAKLRSIYQPTYDAILKEFREEANWPDFNPSSPRQRAAFLFSNAIYKDKMKAPENAIVLDLTPLYNSDKYPVEWTRIMEEDEKQNGPGKPLCIRAQMMNSPSTKVATLEMLSHRYPEIRTLTMLKQLSILGQFLKTYLVDVPQNEFGVREDGKSICHNISVRDGRVRGHLHQTSTTGRYRMSKANLQTNPKKQEDAALAIFLARNMDWIEEKDAKGLPTKRPMTVKEYRDRTDDSPKSKCPPELKIPKEKRLDIPMFKSCYVPDAGNVFIEVDFKTAELCVLAFASGDKILTEIIEEGRDLHSEVAMRAFKKEEFVTELERVLGIQDPKERHKSYKDWVERVKKLYTALRTAAKTVVFGLMYGRGAAALAREIGKEVPGVTKEDCQEIIDSFAGSYRKAWAWIQANMESAENNGYVETPFGRRRWFPGVEDMDDRGKAAVRREAANSPIQGCVADMLAVAGINLYRFRYGTDIGRQIGFKVCIPVHDAFIIEVKAEFVREMKQILQLCMVDLNKIPGTDKSIKIDVEVFRKRLGELDQELPSEMNKAA
jgi:uracil-DNA glycosylase family 4